MTKTMRVKNRRRSWGGAGQAPLAYPRVGFKKWTVEKLMEALELRYGGSNLHRSFYPQWIKKTFRARPGIVTKALFELNRQGKLGRRSYIDPVEGGLNGGRTTYYFKTKT